MAYLPEDPEWNKTLNVWFHKTWRCKRPLCNIEFKSIDNVGAWRCRQELWDPLNNRPTTIPSDHAHDEGRIYSNRDDIVIPLSVAPFLRGRTRMEAVVNEPVEGQSSDGIRRPYAMIKIRRYDEKAFQDVYYGCNDKVT